ncbi:WAS/WASL-interacting protein family member 3-like [Dendrobium catenatum]|uniref:WAS/WASL-interacting protein family member 3-like n=1 Tax=Dendrobium catenatum TaxID=906689 RepID=UPI0010A00191|nr:WAS/WASL-interacting protein family member 3-like [Dendrobium catenatum]
MPYRAVDLFSHPHRRRAAPARLPPSCPGPRLASAAVARGAWPPASHIAFPRPLLSLAGVRRVSIPQVCCFPPPLAPAFPLAPFSPTILLPLYFLPHFLLRLLLPVFPFDSWLACVLRTLLRPRILFRILLRAPALPYPTLSSSLLIPPSLAQPLPPPPPTLSCCPLRPSSPPLAGCPTPLAAIHFCSSSSRPLPPRRPRIPRFRPPSAHLSLRLI